MGDQGSHSDGRGTPAQGPPSTGGGRVSTASKFESVDIDLADEIGDDDLTVVTPSVISNVSGSRRFTPVGDDDATRVTHTPDVISHAGESGQLSPRQDTLFGTVLADRYRVLDLIGKGGMGKVYLAEHVAIGKKVAIKVLSQAYCHRPDQVKRFLREARAASTIDHENVIDITDFGEMDNGSVFFVMEYLSGSDLGKLLRKTGALPWKRARRIFVQICRALQAAHSKGIIHRDIKPENCFLINKEGRPDFVKVLDFGIAKVVDEERQNAHTLTQAGALIGTPEYMAPEQVKGEAADPRMDVYSVGCIMYQALTGHLPFKDTNMFGVLNQQVHATPKPLREVAPNAAIPPNAEAIVLRCMEKDPAARFQSMREIIESIGGSTMSGEDLMAELAAYRAAAMSFDEGLVPAGDGLLPETEPSAPDSVNDTGRFLTGPVTLPGQNAMMFKVTVALAALVLMLALALIYVLATRGGDEEGAAVAEAESAGDSSAEEPVTPTIIKAPDLPKDPESESEGDSSDGGEDVVVEDDTSDEVEEDPPTKPEPAPSRPTKKVSKKTKKKDTGTKKTPPKNTNLPKNLDFKTRKSVQDKVASTIRSKCKGSGGAPAGSIVRIEVKVSGSTGRVLSAKPTKAPNSSIGSCAAKAVKKSAKFPRFKDASQSFGIAFKL